jgi:hypothetical protein
MSDIFRGGTSGNFLARRDPDTGAIRDVLAERGDWDGEECSASRSPVLLVLVHAVPGFALLTYAP